MKNAVICFTRVPKPGQTKTRLMPYLSGEQCAELHWAFLQDLGTIYATLNADLLVAHTPDSDWAQLKTVFPNAFFFPQEGEDLGAKMNHALNLVLSMGYEKCILTGSDLPRMTLEHLLSGFEALEQADVTLGPTSDGGYYLVGVKEESPFLFKNQTYGCGNVFENTVAAVKAADKSFCPALCCDDVDTPEDLNKLLKMLNPESHTAAYLRKLGEKL